jgi:hypothetical protein
MGFSPLLSLFFCFLDQYPKYDNTKDNQEEHLEIHHLSQPFRERPTNGAPPKLAPVLQRGGRAP